MILDLPHFIDTHQPDWDELEAMLRQLDDVQRVRWSVEQAQRFHLLYQKAGADLVKLQTFASEPKLCQYLESIVASAYAEIHEERRRKTTFRPWHWFTHTFPATFQRHARAFYLSVAITLLGVALGGGIAFADPEAKADIMPFAHLHGSPSERVAQEESQKKREPHSDGIDSLKARFSAQLMQHNIQVSIFAFALGVTFGAGTFVLLFYNGVVLGLVAVDYLLDGQGVFLTAWLLPHGSIEIPAILIAGQAGLLLGGTLIGRGEQRLGLAGRLRKISPDLVTLIGGVAVLLVWAGIIEAFVSQYHEPVLPYSVKIAFGISQLGALLYLLGRQLPIQKKKEAKEEKA